MLLQAMEKALTRDFPDLAFKLDESESRIVIPPKNKDFGEIVIQDDGDELTVLVGDFTHWHASCWEDFSPEKIEREIVEDVAEFLRGLFEDQIVVWSSLGAGGYYTRGETPFLGRMLKDIRQEWVWSGRLTNAGR